ncbi:MAG: c-type cytochrome [Agarilytica sp.]
MFNSRKLMRSSVKSIIALVCLTSTYTYSGAQYEIGRTPTAEEIAGWDIDVRPDGKGLPPGEGSVEDGEMIYEDKCAACHGTFGEGEKRWPKLAGGSDTLTHQRPDKTVGSYWPYVSTLWDYIHRAMPFNAPQSLTNDEVYAVTAYVLNLNDLLDDDAVLNQSNLASIEMPNAGNFFRDNRPDVSNTRCMKKCKAPKSIQVKESLSGVTPTDHFKKDGNDGVAYAEEHAPVAEVKTLSAAAKAGQATYKKACMVCHGSGLAGAPKVGDAGEWAKRETAGMDKLYSNAINGYQGDAGVMPPKGGQMQLSDEAVKQAVDFMVESSAH